MDELTFDFVQASGPGGQNVNKVATRAQLRFDVGGSACLGTEVKERLRRLAGTRLTSRDVLIIEAGRYRARERNRADALERFIGLLKKALTPPKPRFKTRPSAAAKEQRLRSKKIRAEIKRSRRGHAYD